MHRNVELVLAALADAGVDMLPPVETQDNAADPARAARLKVLPDAVATAAAAAAALGVEVGQIANSLVFDADGSPLLVMTSGAHRVDTGKVAAIVGATTVRRASAEFVRAATGQVIGGVSPVGHPAPIRTLVDRALETFDEVWAAGGIPHAIFPTTFAELIAVTGGVAADVA